MSRATVQYWRAKFPAFKEAWDICVQEAIDSLEEEAWRRAREGSDFLLWKLLQSARREKYGDRVEVQVNIRRKVEELAEQYQLPAGLILEEAQRIMLGEGSTHGSS